MPIYSSRRKKIPLNKEYSLDWDAIQRLPEDFRNEFLESFMSDYEWIRHAIEEEEAKKILSEHPIKAKYNEYGIHGVMVTVEFEHRGTLIHLNTYKKEYFHQVMPF